jgi:hypothetical protein
MANGGFHFRPDWLAAIGAALPLFLSVVVLPGDSAGLEAGVLAQSRGGNTSLVLTQSSCDSFDGNAPCTVVGAVCDTCSTSTYTNVIGGANGGYNPGAAGGGSCGNELTGLCLNNGAGFRCSTIGQVGPCNNPIGPPTVQ